VLTHELPTGARLRLPEEADAAAVAAVVAHNREHLAPWLPWAAGSTEQGVLEWIRASRRRIADNAGLVLLVEDHGGIAGSVGTGPIDWPNRSATLGYWLAAEAQGRGTMTAAVRAFLDHAFGTWRLNRIEIRAAPDNARSRAVPERLGFVAEGTLRQAERFGDHYVDHVVYAMLAGDWPQADTTR
jgi:ribosomal-protein-serine acetyltransferase